MRVGGAAATDDDACMLFNPSGNTESFVCSGNNFDEKKKVLICDDFCWYNSSAQTHMIFQRTIKYSLNSLSDPLDHS